MTKKQQTRLATIDKNLREKVDKYNAMLSTGKTSVKLDEEIKELVNERTSIMKNAFYNDCIATGDAMLEAVKHMQFTSLGTKDVTTREGDEKVTHREIVQRTFKVDLLNLDKFAGGIGHDKQWKYMIEQLNLVLTLDHSKGTNDGRKPEEIRDCYAMQKLSREIDLGKNPASNTQLLKNMTAIVQAMIGPEYKCTSHDVRWVKDMYCKEGKNPGEAACATHKTLTRYFGSVCWHLVTGGDYRTLFKETKSK